jgi:hypothetical protein
MHVCMCVYMYLIHTMYSARLLNKYYLHLLILFYPLRSIIESKFIYYFVF